MILHANAALGRRQRLRLVSLVAGGVTIAAAAAIVGCSRQTGSKWVGRDKRERPGELLPLDLKKMGRIPVPGHRVTGDRSRRASQGGLALPVRRDRRRDPTRLGFAPLYPAASTECALAFLDACRRFY